MKRVVFSGWNARRVFYLLAGLGLMVVSFRDMQWLGLVAGGYFAAMGLFAFGCAGGSCLGNACEKEDQRSAIDKLN